MKKSISRLVIYTAFISILFLSDASFLYPAMDTTPANDKVIIYMVEGLTLEDINPQTTPYLWDMQKNGGLGLLNPVTGGERTIKNVLCTISAGKPAIASRYSHLNFMTTEQFAGENSGCNFYNNTGILPGKSNIIVSTVNVIHKNNERKNLQIPGKLGDKLHQLGYRTAVIGNSDRSGICNRPGVLLLMDSKGLVDYGLIDSSVNKIDTTSPALLWTDYEAIHKQFNQIGNKTVVLIEYGDLSRLNVLYSYNTPVHYRNKRQQILTDIDKSISHIEAQLGHACVSYVISPGPARSYKGKDILTPVIINKPGLQGIIKSYSTRRDGIILPGNITGSILNSVDTSYRDPITGAINNSTNSVYSRLMELKEKATFNYEHQTVILGVHIIIALILLFLAIWLILSGKKGKGIAVLGYVITLPLGFLLMALINIMEDHIFIIMSLGISLFIAISVFGISHFCKKNPLLNIMVLTIASIIIDLATGGHLISNSILSYKIISGARYYGIGNEYMGILIGSAAACSALLLNEKDTRINRLICIILFSLITFIIACPLLGINVGGTITACVALGFTSLKIYQQPVKKKEILLLIAGTLGIISLMALFDMSRPMSLQSHLGHNISLIFDNGWGEILTIVQRKALMHLALINYSLLGWVLLAAIVLFTFMVFRPPQFLKTVKNRLPAMYVGLQGLLVAAITAFIFNDSGITAAAAISLYFTVILLCSISQTR